MITPSILILPNRFKSRRRDVLSCVYSPLSSFPVSIILDSTMGATRIFPKGVTSLTIFISLYTKDALENIQGAA
jgi:hypothetical protein